MQTSSVYIANYTPPSDPPKQILLSFTQVVSCFHEVGHSIRNLCQQNKYVTTGACARAFTEIPSILLEHLFWHPSVIRYVSGRRGADGAAEEKLPDEDIRRLISSWFAGEVMTRARIIADAVSDLYMHMPQSHDELLTYDAVREYNRL